MRRRHHLLSRSLKIKYIKSIRRLLDSALLKRFADRWNGRQQGTGCDELQKCATIGHETSGEQNASKNGVLLIQKLGKSKESFRVYGRMIDRRPWQGSSMAPTAT